VEAVACALCGREDPVPVRHRDPYTVVRCRGCDLIFLSPRPVGASMAAIYGAAYFESGDAACPGYRSYASLERSLAREADDKLAVVSRVCPPPARLLDHGCGSGVFLEAALARGYDAVGIDLSPYAVERVRQRGLPAEVASLEDGWGEAGSFDVVTSWDVLEHVPDPIRTVSAAHRLLRPGGYLVATTPDASGIDARLLGRRWYGFTKVPEHNYFFTRPTFTRLLRVAGLTPLVFRRWGFVRDIAFGLNKLADLLEFAALRRLAGWAETTHLGRTQLSCPFIDMLVVARRQP
jgi:SAM-dependent methyltransferase